MAKRIIHECDLTKHEIEEDEPIFTLRLAKKGMRANMTYEISAAAAEKLLAQLNGRDQLDNEWSFANGLDRINTRRTFEDLEEETLEEEPEDDSQFVARKKAELSRAGVINKERKEPEKSTMGEILGATQGENGCIHMNKGRIQTTLKGGKRFAFRICNDCRARIPEPTAEERRQYMSGKPPKDVNIREL